MCIIYRGMIMEKADKKKFTAKAQLRNQEENNIMSH